MIKDYANKVMDYEYNAFMTLMHVSVSKHLFDEHFTVLWANDYFYELIGYSKEEYETLYHNHVDEYYSNDPESVAQMTEVIMNAFRKNESGYEFECPMHVKGGSIAWIRVTGRFTDEVFNGIPVIYTLYTDITHLKEMQLALEKQSGQLNDALALAEKASRAKSEFLSRMSHDIRTPMNAIIGMTDIAAAHVGEPERIKDCLKKISLSGQHLLGLINDVLDMSKIETGNMSLHMENISLPTLLENVVAIMQPVFKERNQHFSVRLHQVVHEDFICDSLRLRQIFINILSNASKFTPVGGRIEFDVKESSSDRAGYAIFHFTFTDTGSGISPEYLPHIFDAFSRQNDNRMDKTEGSGLGMAITHRLTELFGGTISVESRLGEGSVFYVELPMEIAGPPEGQDSYAGAKILVVDNDNIVCEYLVQILTELDVHAVSVNNGKDAVGKVLQAHLLNEDYDMVLLDWQMPGMDGVRTAQAIREKVGDSLPILIASAYDWSDIREEALSCGINGFLQKPLFKSTLSWGIQNFIYERKLPQKEEERISFGGKRFLLVEDNELNLEIAVELLTSMGASVDTACDGQQGVTKFEQSREGYYDLILMDIQMPIMNGYEATRKIRALQRPDAAGIPILAMTADAFAEDVAAAMEAGMTGHMAKPLDAYTINHEISRYL